MNRHYSSAEMLKTPIVQGRRWENVAPLGSKPRWISVPAIPGELERARERLARPTVSNACVIFTQSASAALYHTRRS